MNSKDVKFVMSNEGLYYHDVRWMRPETTYSTNPRSSTNIIMLQTVEGNEMGYTKRELTKAREAKRLYVMLDRPSYRDFGNIVRW